MNRISGNINFPKLLREDRLKTRKRRLKSIDKYRQ